MEKHLIVSEVFYSLQGEGPTMGHPAVFLRLAGCNLLCGRTDYNKGKTWDCDTVDVWRKGKKVPYYQILDKWVYSLREGAHLVITGGEPLLQQDKIADFLLWFRVTYKFVPFIEVETNCTITPNESLQMLVMQWNCSPKLANSGEHISNRFNVPVIKVMNRMDNTVFKFVVNNLGDWDEIKSQFIKTDLVSKKKIWLMPAAEDLNTLLKVNQLVADIAIDNYVRMSTRLQVEIWDKTVGV